MRHELCLCLAIIVCGFGLLETADAQTIAKRPRIIDVHLHAHPPEAFLGHRKNAPVECALPTVIPPLDMTMEASDDLASTYFRKRLNGCGKLLEPAQTEEDLIQRTLGLLETYNITAVVSSSIENVRKWKAAAPSRIIQGIDPIDPLGVVESGGLDLGLLRKLLIAKDVQVIGEVGSQYLGRSPSDPSLGPLFALAQEFDVPVGIHIGLSAPGIPVVTLGSFRASASRPLELESVLVKYPRLRLYVMHAGWPMLDETLHLLWSFPQVYVDVAVLNWLLPQQEFYVYLKRLVDAGFGTRIMYGSDQMIWPDAIEVSIKSIEAAPFLTAEQKRDIFCRNAARFLRLNPSTCT